MITFEQYQHKKDFPSCRYLLLEVQWLACQGHAYMPVEKTKVIITMITS